MYNYILYDFIIFYSSQRSFTIISITNKYSDLVHFNNLLTEIGLNDTQIVRLESDGFITMEELVSHYQTGGASDFEKYLCDPNKTFVSVALRFYYNLVIINRLCSCLTYFLLYIYSFHTIPDIELIDVATLEILGLFWTKFNPNKKIKTNKSDDDTNIDLPKLNGASSWISFRDTFIHKLRDTFNSRGFSLAYLVDTSPRQATHGNATLLDIDIIDLEEEDVLETKTIHFGSSYPADNKRPRNTKEAELLNSDPYNMIAQLFRTKDGLKAWIVLKSHYKGEGYVQQIREEAMSKLKTVHYCDETRNFK